MNNPRFFPWYGGKYRMTGILRNLIPSHRLYLEPFLGSGALLLHHPRSPIEIVNDLDRDVANLFSIMADREKGKELINKLGSLPYGKGFFNSVRQEQKAGFHGFSDMDRALLTYVMISQSFNAARGAFSNKRFSGEDAYHKNIITNIQDVYERLEGVQVWNIDAMGLIDHYANCSDVFAFLDPPYRSALRGENADKIYKFELPDWQHIQLLKLIRQAKCKVLLCGYKEETGIDLYDSFLLPYGWHCYLLAEIVKSSQDKKKKDIGREFIWCNYELPSWSKYYISMKEHRTVS